jgi:hypothetical protein
VQLLLRPLLLLVTPLLVLLVAAAGVATAAVAVEAVVVAVAAVAAVGAGHEACRHILGVCSSMKTAHNVVQPSASTIHGSVAMAHVYCKSGRACPDCHPAALSWHCCCVAYGLR